MAKNREGEVIYSRIDSSPDKEENSREPFRFDFGTVKPRINKGDRSSCPVNDKQ